MIAVAFRTGGPARRRLFTGSAYGLGAPPRLKLTVSVGPFTRRALGFQLGEHVIVRIDRGKVHTKLEPDRPEEPDERGQGGLASVPFVGGDHRGRHSRPPGYLRLAQACLQPSQLQECGGR